MPFRTPAEYDTLTVTGRDPGPQALLAYINWLRRELATAEAALATHADQATTPSPSPKKQEFKT